MAISAKKGHFGQICVISVKKGHLCQIWVIYAKYDIYAKYESFMPNMSHLCQIRYFEVFEVLRVFEVCVWGTLRTGVRTGFDMQCKYRLNTGIFGLYLSVYEHVLTTYPNRCVSVYLSHFGQYGSFAPNVRIWVKCAYLSQMCHLGVYRVIRVFDDMWDTCEIHGWYMGVYTV